MYADIYKDARRFALQAGLFGVRVGEWATKEGHALLVTAHDWLEETQRTMERAEAAEHPHGFGAEEPAVPVEDSVTEEHIVCLEDGKAFKSLTRHLKVAHGLTPAAYREKWGLPEDYPMSARAARRQAAAERDAAYEDAAAPQAA